MIKAIIGLGNEGSQYERTYHNVGQRAVKFFKEDLGDSIAFFIPGGFMNNIGRPVKQFLKEKKLVPEEILIVHDDSDILLGNFKFAKGGGAGGHNGVADIISQLGTEDFWRLKIGIRPKIEKARKKAGEFVLRKISFASRLALTKVFKKALKDLLDLTSKQS